MVITVKFDGKLVLLTSLYLFIGIFALLFAYPSLSIWLPSNSAEMASWVQAIGSMLAIGGAAGIASWQISKKKQEKLAETMQKEIHYCEICLQMCQAVFSLVRAAEAIEDRLFEVGKENDKDKFKLHWERYTSVERIDNIQVSIIALLGKDMSSELMKHIFSIQKNISIYRESMALAKIQFKYWKELELLDQKNNLRDDVDKIYKKLIDYRARLLH